MCQNTSSQQSVNSFYLGHSILLTQARVEYDIPQLWEMGSLLISVLSRSRSYQIVNKLGIMTNCHSYLSGRQSEGRDCQELRWDSPHHSSTDKYTFLKMLVFYHLRKSLKHIGVLRALINSHLIFLYFDISEFIWSHISL